LFPYSPPSSTAIHILSLHDALPILGGIVSFIGFTLPSIIVLVIFALLYQSFSLEGAIFIQSLKVVAVSVVLHALIGLGKKLTPDKSRLAIALVSAIVLLLYPS